MPPYRTSNSYYPKHVWDNSGKKLKFKGSSLKQDKTTFTSKNQGSLFLVHELDTWSRDLSTDFTLKNCFFGSVKLTKNAYLDKCTYRCYAKEFNSRSLFSLPNFN